ncbi:hypothetical protein Tco_0809914 [Tanacetum coccineum]
MVVGGDGNGEVVATIMVVPLVSSAQAGVNVPVIESASDAHTSSVPELEDEALSATPSQGSSADNFYESQTIDSATALNVYVPNWNITNNARIGNLVTCQNLLDHVTPPVSELRLHYEHEIMMREKFEKKFTDSSAIVQQKDAEIVDLKARLEKSEVEAAEVAELRKRVSDLESMVAVKVGEVATLNTQNAGLLEKVFALELVRGELDGKVAQLTADCDGLRDQVVGEGTMWEEFVSQQDAAGRHFSEQGAEFDAPRRRWVVRHDFRLAVHKCARSVECRSALGKVISMAINKEGLKDSPLALIMSALTLKDDHGNTDVTPEFRQFQPSLDQVTVPVYSESGSIDREMLLSDDIPVIRKSVERRRVCPPPSSTLGKASSSAPPHDSSLGVANYQVSTLVLSGDGGSVNQPPVVQSHDDLFDTSVLDKFGDA